MWLERAAGSEYSSVRTLCLPVAVCLNVSNWVLNTALALDTGREIVRRSPAGVRLVDVSPFSFKNALMASRVSCFGATYASTYTHHHQQFSSRIG